MGKILAVLAAAGTAVLVGCGGFSGTFPTDDLDCTIPGGQILSGGVSRDGIPALTNPDIGPAQGASLASIERVLGLVVNGEARAYPFAVLWWHEIINDTLGGEPVLVSYCPLTGSGIAFDPHVKGQLRNFGVSGLLFENNLIMFDRATESLWNQMLLGSQCGPDRGTALTRVPIMETTWGHWQQLHPNTTYVTRNTGFFNNYSVYPYGNYAVPTNGSLLFPGSHFSSARPPKELTLGVHRDGEAVAYSFGILRDLGDVLAINDQIADLPLLVTWVAAGETAVAFDRRVNGQTLTFSVADTAALTFVDAETGTTWDAKGTAVAGPLAGSQLAQFNDAFVVFWFAWSVYYPNTRLFE